jgi:hypothetical protein
LLCSWHVSRKVSTALQYFCPGQKYLKACLKNKQGSINPQINVEDYNKKHFKDKTKVGYTITYFTNKVILKPAFM